MMIEVLLELVILQPDRIIGIGSIILNGKNNTNDVYFVDGLRHNLLTVGQLVENI